MPFSNFKGSSNSEDIVRLSEIFLCDDLASEILSCSRWWNGV